MMYSYIAFMGFYVFAMESEHAADTHWCEGEDTKKKWLAFQRGCLYWRTWRNDRIDFIWSGRKKERLICNVSNRKCDVFHFAISDSEQWPCLIYKIPLIFDPFVLKCTPISTSIQNLICYFGIKMITSPRKICRTNCHPFSFWCCLWNYFDGSA